MNSSEPGKRMKSTHRKMRKKEIINSAERIFARKGFENTTMQDVADDANIGIATVFRFFPKKEQLIIETATKQFEYIRDFLIDVETRPILCFDKVEYIFNFMMETIDNKHLATFVILDSFGSYFAYKKAELLGIEALEIVFHEIEEIFGEIILEGKTDGSIRNIENLDECLKVITSAFSTLVGKFSKQKNILLFEHEIGVAEQLKILKEAMLSYLRPIN